MLRIPRFVPFLVVLVWFCACSGRGGGSAPPAEVLVELGAVSTMAGVVVTFDAPSAAFGSGLAFDGEWRQNGVALASGRWASVTTRQLVTIVPTTLPVGDYEVSIVLGSARAKAVVQVAAAPFVADPAAAVQAFADDVVTAMATLRMDAGLLRDTALAASLVADLDRLEIARATFESELANASPSDLEILATVLAATPAMTVLLESEGDCAGVQQNLDTASQNTLTNTAAWQRGVALVGMGIVVGATAGSTGVGAVVGAVVAAGLILAGGVQIVRGVGGVARATDLLLTAIETAVMTLMGRNAVPACGNGEIVIPVLLEGAEASSLTVVVAVPFPLAATGSFATLSESDRSRSDIRLQLMFTTIDNAVATQQGLASSVTAFIQTPFPAVAAQPRIGTGVIFGASLSIEQQSNPQVVLSLANGELTATLQGATAPVTTEVTFRYDEGELGVLTQTVTVEVIDLLPNMVPIAAGQFSMGSGAYVSQYPWTSAELPVHPVTITQPFWMGKYEVTQAEYQALMGSNPSYWAGANLPVEQVTWFNAVAYCDALSVQEAAAGRLPVGYEYRLPTEAEWEYCCRAGTTTEWNVGGSLSCGQANFYDQNGSGFCVQQTSAVGNYAANAWGVYDMHGNVWEWCLDSWDGSANYPAGGVSNPYVTSGPGRVFRGGCWFDYSDYCRSAYRDRSFPTGWDYDLGFRVVLAPVLP